MNPEEKSHRICPWNLIRRSETPAMKNKNKKIYKLHVNKKIVNSYTSS